MNHILPMLASQTVLQWSNATAADRIRLAARRYHVNLKNHNILMNNPMARVLD